MRSLLAGNDENLRHSRDSPNFLKPFRSHKVILRTADLVLHGAFWANDTDELLEYAAERPG